MQIPWHLTVGDTVIKYVKFYLWYLEIEIWTIFCGLSPVDPDKCNVDRPNFVMLIWQLCDAYLANSTWSNFERVRTYSTWVKKLSWKYKQRNRTRENKPEGQLLNRISEIAWLLNWIHMTIVTQSSQKSEHFEGAFKHSYTWKQNILVLFERSVAPRRIQRS